SSRSASSDGSSHTSTARNTALRGSPAGGGAGEVSSSSTEGGRRSTRKARVPSRMNLMSRTSPPSMKKDSSRSCPLDRIDIAYELARQGSNPRSGRHRSAPRASTWATRGEKRLVTNKNEKSPSVQMPPG